MTGASPDATTNVSERIESGLYALAVEVDWLPETATEWDRVPEAERVSILLDWDHLLQDYLPELERFYRQGVMTQVQTLRYRHLLWKMQEMLPLFECLGVSRIPVPPEP